MSFDNRYSLKPISEVDEKLKASKLDIHDFHSECAGDLSMIHKESSNIVEDDGTGEIRIITGAFKLGKVPD